MATSKRTENLKKLLQTKGVVTNLKESLKKGVNVSPEEVSQIFEDNSNYGRVVPTCSRPLPCISLGKVSNLTSFEKEEKTYFDVSSSDLKIYAFPEVKKQVDSIYSSIWSGTKKYQACGSNLMAKEIFINEYMPFLAKKQEKLEEIKEQILANYAYEMGDRQSGEVGRFELMVKKALEKVPTDLETEIRSHLDYLTSISGEDFVKQYKISLFTDFTEEEFENAPEKMTELLTEFKKNHLINSGMQIVKGLLTEGWTALISYLSSMEKNIIDDDLTISSFGRMRTTYNQRAKKICKEIADMETAGLNSPYISIIASLINDIKTIEFKYDAEEVILNAMALIKQEADKSELTLVYPKEIELNWVTPLKLDEIFEAFCEAFE